MASSGHINAEKIKNKIMDEDLVKEQEENENIQKAKKENVRKMAEAVKKANAAPDYEEPQEYTAEEQEILRLNVELKDLKDLYDNLGKENQGLTKERNELKAKNLELQSLLNDVNKENASLKHEWELERLQNEKDVVSDETRIDEMAAQIVNLNSIIEKLIVNR